MDAPNPDSGEEYFHTNTQLFGILDEHNRFVGEQVTAPCNAPERGRADDGRLRHRLHHSFTSEMGRQPTYEEYAQIMQCYTPEQVPVLNGVAREFGVFDHWFCEVPSQTFMNRSFWTAATSSGGTINSPSRTGSTTTRRDDLQPPRGARAHVEGLRPGAMPALAHGLIQLPRLHDRFATHFVPFSEFEQDAADGTLPDFA